MVDIYSGISFLLMEGEHQLKKKCVSSQCWAVTKNNMRIYLLHMSLFKCKADRLSEFYESRS